MGKAKVKGNACPDENGKMHKCCHASAKCAYKNQCPGLAGDCCPTPGGMMLGCCLKKGAEAMAAAPLVPNFEAQEQGGGLQIWGLALLVAVAVGLAVGMKLMHSNEDNKYLLMG